jgi:hypothetical protein
MFLYQEHTISGSSDGSIYSHIPGDINAAPLPSLPGTGFTFVHSPYM